MQPAVRSEDGARRAASVLSGAGGGLSMKPWTGAADASTGRAANWPPHDRLAGPPPSGLTRRPDQASSGSAS
jgi:hypothetical protein